MEDKWIEDLRGKMKDYSLPEPEGLWEAVSASVEAGGKTAGEAAGLTGMENRGVEKGGRRRVPVFWVAASSAAAVLILAAVLFAPGSMPEEKTPQVAVMPLRSGTPSEILVASAPEGLSSPPGRLYLMRRPVSGQNPVAGDSSSADRTSDVPGTPDAESVARTIQTFSDDRDATMTVQGPEDYADASRHVPETGGDVDAEQDVMETGSSAGAIPDSVNDGEYDASFSPEYPEVYADGRRYASRNRVSADLFYSNAPGTSGGGTGLASLLSSPVPLGREQVGSLLSMSDPAGVGLFSNGDEIETKVRHRQPVRAGISVRYGLTRRWSLETGITYTMLSSDIEAGSGTRTYVADLSLHYIGIPLQVNFDVFARKRWSLYLTAGGMVEKCVAGNEKVKSVTAGVHETVSSKNNVTVKPLQWSVGAAAGAEFDFTPAVGIYVEPGVQYSFHNSGPYRTVWQDRPVNFSLEVGLRFNFR
ncbi:MAG: PorT family protein [Bacteroidetes bacterium]|uniref:PorT family protein n=1 Tax=Candidatus Cryptobacteroides excrementavium TaxID=2840759 RepID=A0A9D9NR80_9BACT|nr:PorT family protein [Candidatus Cryptobacteroides excrementavium]